MSAGFEVVHLDELEALPVDEEGLTWRPVRRRFGIEAFGVNAYTGGPGDRVVEEHTESRNGHDELYVVLSGSAVFTLDGEQVEAPAGTFVFVKPKTRRGALAGTGGATVLALGGRAGQPFSVSSWEPTFAAYAYQRQGEHTRALEAIDEGLARHPGLADTHYHAACINTLQGNRDAALDHLRRAAQIDGPQTRRMADGDSDLDVLRDDPRFAEVLDAEGQEE